jgi:ElaB/YqjD/DUF883 family membrane-anchored ribosome-binding protein
MKPTATRDTRESLTNEFETVVDEAEQLLKSVADSSADAAAGLRLTINERIADATERLERLRAGATDQALATVEATDRYVQDNPWRAVGMSAAIAGLAGVVLGAWIARR